MVKQFLQHPLVKRLVSLMARLFVVGWAVRNVLGAIAVIPIFAKMIQMGGTPMAIWIAICSVAGVALNIIIPALAYQRLKKVLA